MLVCGMLAALTNADIQFLLDTEQYQLLNKYEQQLVALLDGSEADIRLALDWAARTGNDPLALRCHGKLALQHHSIEDALQWINLADRSGMDSLAVAAVIVQLQSEFSAPEDKVILDYFLYDIPQEDYLEQIRQLRSYSPFIEDLAKSWADEISVEPSDSLAMGMIDRFEYYFPVSKWAQVAFYYRLFHLSKAGDFAGLAALIDSAR